MKIIIEEDNGRITTLNVSTASLNVRSTDEGKPEVARLYPGIPSEDKLPTIGFETFTINGYFSNRPENNIAYTYNIPQTARCPRCAGLGYINPAPFTKLYNCPDCQKKTDLPNYEATAKRRA